MQFFVARFCYKMFRNRTFHSEIFFLLLHRRLCCSSVRFPTPNHLKIDERLLKLLLNSNYLRNLTLRDSLMTLPETFFSRDGSEPTAITEIIS